MDNDAYTDVALRLANADLSGVDGLRAALHDEPWWSERATEGDLAALLPVAGAVRRVLDRAAAGDAGGVLDEANAMLAKYPLRPRLSAGHGAGPPQWHIHVASADAPPGTEVAAAAAWGIAHGIVHFGLDRWGRCAAAGCGNYFLDTSSNRTKRFCSPRCANRVHVAAFRSRTRPDTSPG